MEQNPEREIILNGAYLREISYKDLYIKVRSLSSVEVLYLTREFELRRWKLDEYVFLARSLLFFGDSLLQTFDLRTLQSLAVKLRSLPTPLLKKISEAQSSVQIQYYGARNLVFRYMVTPDSRVLWSNYKNMGEPYFRKYDLWNDYQLEWITFNTEEDKVPLMDAILLGTKLLISTLTKLPEEVESMTFSSLQKESKSADRVKALEAQVKDFAEGRHDDHDRRVKEAEERHEALLKAHEEAIMKIREDRPVPEGDCIVFLSPEDVLARSRKCQEKQ